MKSEQSNFKMMKSEFGHFKIRGQTKKILDLQTWLKAIFSFKKKMKTFHYLEVLASLLQRKQFINYCYTVVYIVMYCTHFGTVTNKKLRDYLG